VVNKIIKKSQLEKKEAIQPKTFERNQFIVIENKDLGLPKLPSIENKIFSTSIKYKEVRLDTSVNLDTSYKEALVIDNYEYINDLILDIKNINLTFDSEGNLLNYLKNDAFNILGDLKHLDYNIFYKFNEYNILIVGYPDPKHMNPLLSNDNFKRDLENIIKNQRINYLDYIKKIYNLMNDRKINHNNDNLYDMIINNTFLKIEESYKLLKSIEKYYNIKPEIDMKTYIEECNNKLNKELLSLFNKGNIRIKYVFQIFNIDEQNQPIKPMILSPRELNRTNKPILEKILELIQKKIPSKFFLTDIETNFYRVELNFIFIGFIIEHKVSNNPIHYFCILNDSRDMKP
jgi:hypothetical protein